MSAPAHPYPQPPSDQRKETNKTTITTRDKLPSQAQRAPPTAAGVSAPQESLPSLWLTAECEPGLRSAHQAFPVAGLQSASTERCPYRSSSLDILLQELIS